MFNEKTEKKKKKENEAQNLIKQISEDKKSMQMLLRFKVDIEEEKHESVDVT